MDDMKKTDEKLSGTNAGEVFPRGSTAGLDKEPGGHLPYLRERDSGTVERACPRSLMNLHYRGLTDGEAAGLQLAFLQSQESCVLIAMRARIRAGGIQWVDKLVDAEIAAMKKAAEMIGALLSRDNLKPWTPVLAIAPPSCAIKD
jgi:hypothetical protein